MTWSPSPLTDCEKCNAYLLSLGWAAMHAFASVGIERGKSTAQMAREYLQAYHERGHQK